MKLKNNVIEMIIDAHMHSDSRPVEDFRDISMAGIKAVVSCAYDPLEMKQSNVSFEHFDRIVYREKKRVEQQNVKLFAAVGVHPRAIPVDYEKVLEEIPNYMKEDHVIAIGEIGLENIEEKQEEVFIKQLRLADENNYKVIVHTPRTDKRNVTSRITELLDENINPKLVQLDHIDFSIIDDVIDKDYSLAITTQPLKMSVEDTVEMLDKYGFDKFVLDSDMSYAPSNPMSLARVKHELKVNSYREDDINKVMYRNFLKFHKITL